MPSLVQVLSVLTFVCASLLEVEAKKGSGKKAKAALTVGGYVGAAIGAVFALSMAIIALVICCMCRKSRRERARNLDEESPEEPKQSTDESDAKPKPSSEDPDAYAVENLPKHGSSSTSDGPQFPAPAHVSSGAEIQEPPRQATT